MHMNMDACAVVSSLFVMAMMTHSKKAEESVSELVTFFLLYQKQRRTFCQFCEKFFNIIKLWIRYCQTHLVLHPTYELLKFQ